MIRITPGLLLDHVQRGAAPGERGSLVTTAPWTTSPSRGPGPPRGRTAVLMTGPGHDNY